MERAGSQLRNFRPTPILMTSITIQSSALSLPETLDWRAFRLAFTAEP
jgi:hypothetical protein